MSHRHDHEAAALTPAIRNKITSTTPGTFAQLKGEVRCVLASLCQFDLLVTVISGIGVNAGSERELLSVSYPNFSQFDNERVGRVVQALTVRTTEREELIPQASDEKLAIVLYLTDQAARKAGGRFFGWEGYHDESITRFIQEYVRLSDQELFL